jgi:3',5'-cyclic AMP phosphodiesterase CpdA
VTAVRPYETLWAALWKSAATEHVARSTGDAGPSGGIEAEHPLLEATDRHLDSLESGTPLPPPPDPATADERDPAVAAYLAQLHHRMAHAKIADDPAMGAELARQLAEFKFREPPWTEMWIQYFEYYAQYPYHLGGQPQYRSWKDAGGDLGFGVVEWRLPADATIAIVGDIGTGTDVAAAVLEAALSFEPDAILHLGDVYYSGTRFEFERRFTGLFESVFDDAGRRVPVFTVPGNHEYFTGAIPFLEYLDAAPLAVSADQRQEASYFALRSADDGWQLLGMDTGFNGHTMSVSPQQQRDALQVLHARDPRVPADPAAGEVTPPAPGAPQVALRDDEADWQRDKIRGFPGRSILLSHHQLYSATQPCGPAAGAAPGDLDREWVNTALWKQLGADFGERVAAWVWGHEHNLGIYADGYRPADWPADPGDDFRALPKGRCAGHAAIPVQDVEDPYAQTYPVPLVSDDVRLGLTGGWYNRGFEVLQLAGAGRPATLRYFQIEGAEPEPLPIHEEAVA